jgi:hypothetical protein
MVNVLGTILAVLVCRQNLPVSTKTLQSATIQPSPTDKAQISFLLPDLGTPTRSPQYAFPSGAGNGLERF